MDDTSATGRNRASRELDDNQRKRLGQYFTPAWIAERIVEHYYGDLALYDRVVEPSCGEGAFLAAIPEHVPAVGVEIDHDLAARAVANTGRTVLIGDFREVALPWQPTVMIGNPPFDQLSVRAFLDRAWALLPDEGRVGFILPACAIQSSATVEQLHRRWSIAQDMLPRNIFPRLSLPLVFARFIKGRRRTLSGFLLYGETQAVHALQRPVREALRANVGRTWRSVVEEAIRALGGEATLDQLYQQIEGCRPTTNPWWRPKCRQIVQRIAVRTGPGRWRLIEPVLVGATRAAA